MVSTGIQGGELNIILLTGLPGVGKTTIVNRLCAHYSAKGRNVQGITTREIRENGQRVGFKITDLATGQEGWLARKDSAAGPRIGSYHVVSEDLERIGVGALERASEGPTDLIVVDEIGPMEMTSTLFRNVISKVLTGEQSTLATVKFGSHYPEVEKIRGKSMELEITKDNREKIYRRLIDQLGDWARQSSG
jgi:nucleoside-triphosphatase